MNEPENMTWRLLGVVNQAGAKLCEAESQLNITEAKLQEADAQICRIRSVAGRLGITLSPPKPSATIGQAHGMTTDEFARTMGWGLKKMRSLVRSHMVEGIHYHKNGRRYVIHPSEAAEFVRNFSCTRVVSGGASLVDDVMRFRARQALGKAAR